MSKSIWKIFRNKAPHAGKADLTWKEFHPRGGYTTFTYPGAAFPDQMCVKKSTGGLYPAVVRCKSAAELASVFSNTLQLGQVGYFQMSVTSNVRDYCSYDDVYEYKQIKLSTEVHVPDPNPDPSKKISVVLTVKGKEVNESKDFFEVLVGHADFNGGYSLASNSPDETNNDSQIAAIDPLKIVTFNVDIEKTDTTHELSHLLFENIETGETKEERNPTLPYSFRTNADTKVHAHFFPSPKVRWMGSNGFGSLKIEGMSSPLIEQKSYAVDSDSTTFVFLYDSKEEKPTYLRTKNGNGTEGSFEVHNDKVTFHVSGEVELRGVFEKVAYKMFFGFKGIDEEHPGEFAIKSENTNDSGDVVESNLIEANSQVLQNGVYCPVSQNRSVVAVAYSGSLGLFVFDKWELKDKENGSINISTETELSFPSGGEVNQPRFVTAVFRKRKSYFLRTSVNPQGGKGTIKIDYVSTPLRDHDPTTNEEKYYEGSIISFKVLPEGSNTVSSVVFKSLETGNVVLSKPVPSTGRFEDDLFYHSLVGNERGDFLVVATFNQVKNFTVKLGEYSHFDGNVSVYVSDVEYQEGMEYPVRDDVVIKVVAIPDRDMAINKISISYVSGGKEQTVDITPKSGYEARYTPTEGGEHVVNVEFGRGSGRVDVTVGEGVVHSSISIALADSNDFQTLQPADYGRKIIPYGFDVKFTYLQGRDRPYLIPRNNRDFKFINKYTNSEIQPYEVLKDGSVIFKYISQDINLYERLFAYVNVGISPTSTGTGSVSSPINKTYVPVGEKFSVSASADKFNNFVKWVDADGVEIGTSPTQDFTLEIKNFTTSPSEYKIDAVFEKGTVYKYMAIFNTADRKGVGTFLVTGDSISSISESEWLEGVGNVKPPIIDTATDISYYKAVLNTPVSIGCVMSGSDNGIKFKNWKGTMFGGVWGVEFDMSSDNPYSEKVYESIYIYPVYEKIRYTHITASVRDDSRNMGTVSISGGKPDASGKWSASVVSGSKVNIFAQPSAGVMFTGWHIKEGGGYAKVSSSPSYTFTADENIELFASFSTEIVGIYAFAKSTKNLTSTWRSKRFITSKPIDFSVLRVDAVEYSNPVAVEIDTFSSPESKAATQVTKTIIRSQDARRLPRVRKERYVEIKITSDGEVDAVAIGTSMGGLSV